MGRPDMKVLARLGAVQRLTELKAEADRLLAFVGAEPAKPRSWRLDPVRRKRAKGGPRKRMGGKLPAPAAKVHWTQRPENRARVKKHLARISLLRGTTRAS